MTARRKSGGMSNTTPSNRTSVAELVYKFLEQASSRNVCKSQKTNATAQFRNLQKRKHSKRLEPRRRQRPNSRLLIRDLSQLLRAFPKTSAPNGDAEMKKCILEVLSIGAVLGFFVPTAENKFDITPELGGMLEK